MDYSFYIASQTSPQLTTLTFETISGGQSLQSHKLFPLDNSYTSFFEMAAIDGRNCSELCSLSLSCKNYVFGANFLFQGNPTFSVVAFFAGLTFNQSFAMYPTCTDDMMCKATSRAHYHYYILFGPVYGKDNSVLLDGVTIQMHQKTEITLQLSGEALALNNTKEESQFMPKNNSNVYTTLWIEPKVSLCERVIPRSLEGTTIVSNKPITVFTNRAKCNTSNQFSYDSQVVHQMPEVNEWGKTFIIDAKQINIMPQSVRNNLEYEIAIRASQNGTTVNTTYYQFNQQPHFNTTALMKGNVHRTVRSMDSMFSVSHISIVANSPVLVLYSIYSQDEITPNNVIYYSVLLQPVEWFSNKQIIALQHPTHDEVYQYHISVVVPEVHYNPKDIHIAKGKDLCRSVSLLEYKGFIGSTDQSNGYVVVYMELSMTGGMDNETQLLLWHRNPGAHMGVTVFAYASDLQYAYSNGYTVGKLILNTELK